ncbi:MAG: L-threonine 3-dehydrogenase [Halanaerobiales bacterium]|nr:L-threonine 3-dehydrogenase [Halanaerobiales bacterium]
MKNKMHAIVKEKPEYGAVYKEVEIPEIGPEQILIQVKSTSICGSDFHIYKWNKWAQDNIEPPQIMGHEVAGDVIEVGSRVQKVKKGDFVSSETHIPCGHCYQCETGQEHICRNMKILGVHQDGVFAEYAVLEEVDVWKTDPSINKDFASIQEPLGNAIDTILPGEVAGKDVLITGAGPVGLIAIAVANTFGAANILVSEPNEYRRNLSYEMGADHVVNPIEVNLLEAVQDIFGNKGVDFTAEMSGHPDAIRDGIKAVTPGGIVSLLGLPDDKLSLDLTNDIIFKNIKVVGITGRKMFSTWHIANNLLKNEKINLSPVITHKMPLKDFEKGMKLMEEGNCGKIILKP